MVFYPFYLRVFHVKIVASLWLIYCIWLALLVAQLFVKPIFGTQRGKGHFRTIEFGSLSQQSGIKALLFRVFLVSKNG